MSEKFSGIVETCGQEGGGHWWIVRVPKRVSQPYKPLANNFGFIAITQKVGKSSWPSSLMPAGDGMCIVAVPTKVRKANNIKLGDRLRLSLKYVSAR